MDIRELVRAWFKAWDEGNYEGIPVTDNFIHTSPYGTIDGKKLYLALVKANKEKFLGNRIEIHDELYAGDRACVRYTITNSAFTMEVSEWLYAGKGLIKEIISYYNIEGDISDDRQLAGLGKTK